MKPSRAMIPLEIGCALTGIALALFGLLIDGPFREVLAERNGVATWFFLLGMPAVVLCYEASREWFTHRWMNLAQRERSAVLRGRLVLTQALCWLYAVYVVLADQDQADDVIAIIGVVNFGLCMWSYWENRRVKREIRIQTTTYHPR